MRSRVRSPTRTLHRGVPVSGKRATAPCGHEGEYVFGDYIRCLTPECDGKAPAEPATYTYYNPSGVRWTIRGIVSK